MPKAVVRYKDKTIEFKISEGVYQLCRFVCTFYDEPIQHLYRTVCIVGKGVPTEELLLRLLRKYPLVLDLYNTLQKVFEVQKK